MLVPNFWMYFKSSKSGPLFYLLIEMLVLRNLLQDKSLAHVYRKSLHTFLSDSVLKVRTICTTRRAKLVIPVLWLAGYVVAIPRQIILVNPIGLAIIFNVFSFVSKVISLRESKKPDFILLQE